MLWNQVFKTFQDLEHFGIWTRNVQPVKSMMQIFQKFKNLWILKHFVSDHLRWGIMNLYLHLLQLFSAIFYSFQGVSLSFASAKFISKCFLLFLMLLERELVSMFSSLVTVYETYSEDNWIRYRHERRKGWRWSCSFWATAAQSTAYLTWGGCRESTWGRKQPELSLEYKAHCLLEARWPACCAPPLQSGWFSHTGALTLQADLWIWLNLCTSLLLIAVFQEC